MIRLYRILSIALLSVPILAARSTPAAEKPAMIVINGPTVIAFFPPIKTGELKNDPDTNESLADFQLCARQVRGALQKRGIEFHELYVHSFRIRIGTTIKVFRPIQADVGYYLVGPNRAPRIEYGVMTSDDLVQVASEYFSTSGN